MKNAQYTARSRKAVRDDLRKAGRWSAPNARHIPSHGRVSADIDGMTPVSEAANLRRKAREQAWADRTLTTGNFEAETRSKLTQAYDRPTRAERFYEDMGVRLRGGRRPVTRVSEREAALASRIDTARKAREAARAEARKAWRS